MLHSIPAQVSPSTIRPTSSLSYTLSCQTATSSSIEGGKSSQEPGGTRGRGFCSQNLQ